MRVETVLRARSTGSPIQPSSTTEPEVTSDRLGKNLTLLACRRGTLAVAARVGVGLVDVELVQPFTDLAAGALVERFRATGRRRGRVEVVCEFDHRHGFTRSDEEVGNIS